MPLYVQVDLVIYYTIITINTYYQIEFVLYKCDYKLHLSTSFLYKLQAVQAFYFGIGWNPRITETHNLNYVLGINFYLWKFFI